MELLIVLFVIFFVYNKYLERTRNNQTTRKKDQYSDKVDNFEFFNIELKDNIYKTFFNKFYIKNFVNRYYNMSLGEIDKCRKEYPNEVQELTERWNKVKKIL